MKKVLCLVLSFAMLLALLPTAGYAADAATLPRFLYVGGVAVVEEYVAGAVTSGQGWHYDVETATLYLTDGADIRYSSTTEDSLENGIYCSDGTLNIHASGTVNITGYGNGINLPDGSLSLYAAEGANVTITGTSAGSEGINSTVDTNYIRFSGKGTVNVNASDGASYGMTAQGSIYIDGVTLNVRGTSNYDDISGTNVLIGQTEGAVVNCLGTTCSGIGGSLTQKVGIYNGSIVHLAEKTTEKSWLLGFHAKTIEIADSTVVMDGLTGAYSIYAMHGTSAVSGASHILIRKMVATEDGAYGLTVGHDPYQLTGEAGYYTRSDAAAEFTADGDITEIYIGYFELYYPSHLTCYYPNGDGTHALGCPPVCNSGLKGESIACGGTANCTTRAFCDICQSSYGEPDLNNHDSSVTLVNGFCPYCPTVEAAVDSDGDGYYEISNGGQLYWFAQQVNGGNSAINGKLTADIVVNENVLNDVGMPDLYESTFREWVPIGSRDTTEYSGKFDGQGHTVSGLYLNDYVDEDVGLFGAINGATIQNIGLVDSWINAVYNVAGIAGYVNYSTVENCYNTSTIKSIGQSGNGASSVGGIAGYVADGSAMINCYNSGRIIGDWWVAGIAGRMYARESLLQNCYNVGSVEGNETVGGLLGKNYGIVTNCYNLGPVEGTKYVGELIGENVYESTVTNCYYCPSENSVGIPYDKSSNPSQLSTFTAEQFFAASGETGAVVDVLNAWVNEQNDDRYKNWHICSGISYYYPTLDLHFVYTDNGETHTVGCALCDVASAEAHSYSYTVEENRITESCQHCSYSASVSLEVPEDWNYDRSVREARYVIEDTTPVSGVLLQYFRCSDDPEAEPELLESAPSDAGTYIVRLSVGEVSVEDTVTVSPIPITLLGAEAETRNYDGTPYVTLDTSYGASGFKVEGILDGDSIEILYDSVEVASANAGEYDQVTAKGLTTGGEDGHNYTVVSEATLPIYNIWGNYETSISIYQKGLTIRLSDQQAASLEALDQNAWEIDAYEGLLEGHSIASIKLIAELDEGSSKYASISVEEGSLMIVDAEGKDVTENYYVWAYPATLTIICPDHDEFVQGFCTNCGGYEEATFNEEDSYYEIANAGQLYWFAEYVNNVDGSVAAVLVNDIAVPESAPQWTPIGSLSHIYSGSFDGRGHSISGLYVNQPEWDYVGLFGYVGYNPEVKNLTITDSTFIGNHYVGALAGYGEVSATNIAVVENVTVRGNADTGTMVGYNAGYFSNCFAYSDSFVGYMYSGYGSIENCYFLSETDDEYGTIGKTAAQFASGEVAYLLQAGQVGEDIWDDETGAWIGTAEPAQIWGQTIGEDAYPVLKGAKVYQVTNCKGETVYSNTDVSGVHMDADNSGRCDYCNVLMQPALQRMVSISLKGNIALNYYMLLSDEVLADSTAYMQFTMADGEIIRIPVSEGVKYTYEGETYYVFSCAVDAKEMTDDVISQFFYAEGSTTEYTYSVQTYAKHILNTSNNAKIKALITAMLNYGAASQIHFGYNTDNLANAEPAYSDVTISGFGAVAGQGTELAKFYSASLILKSETTLRFFFTGSITATYNGQPLEVKERSGLYYVDVVGISAKDLDEDVTITIHDGTNTAEVSFNPMAYCQAVQNDTTGSFNENMKNLVTSLYLYNQAANNYFEEN